MTKTVDNGVVVNDATAENLFDAFTATNNAFIRPASKPRLGFLGTSITEEIQASNNRDQYRSRGYGTWVMVSAMGRFQEVGIRGYSGQTAAFVASQVPTTIADNPDLVIVECLGNEFSTGTPLAEVEASVTSIRDQFVAEGIFCIFLTQWPEDTQNLVDNDRVRNLNDHMQSLAREGTCGIINTSTTIGKGATTNKAGLTYDSIHPENTGAFPLGVRIAEYMLTLFPFAYPEFTQGDSNEIANQFLEGTAGTVGTDVTGVICDDWRADMAVAGVASSVVQMIEEIDADNTISVDVTGVSGDKNLLVRPDAAIAHTIDGDFILEFEWEYLGDLTVHNIMARAQSFGGAPLMARSSQLINTATPMFAGSTTHKGVSRTPVFTWDNGEDVTLFCEMLFSGAGTATFNVKNPRFVRVS